MAHFFEQSWFAIKNHYGFINILIKLRLFGLCVFVFIAAC